MVGKSLHILLYSGKGENFCEFHGFVAICESFLRKFWGRGVLWHGTGEQSAQVFSAKIVFPQVAKVFSLESFPLYGIM